MNTSVSVSSNGFASFHAIEMRLETLTAAILFAELHYSRDLSSKAYSEKGDEGHCWVVSWYESYAPRTYSVTIAVMTRQQIRRLVHRSLDSACSLCVDYQSSECQGCSLICPMHVQSRGRDKQPRPLRRPGDGGLAWLPVAGGKDLHSRTHPPGSSRDGRACVC